MVQMQVMHDSSEVIYYDVPGLPAKVFAEKISDYHDMRAICHWHEDIELMYIVSGYMDYEVNGRTVRLKEGNSLFINSRQLHYGYSEDKTECKFVCVLFHPSILRVSEKLYSESVLPVVHSDSVEYLIFDGGRVSDNIAEINLVRHQEESRYEWKILSLLTEIWGEILMKCDLPTYSPDLSAFADRQVQRNMVSYIFQNYTEPLTLGMIASAGNVSRSKCCAVFKKFLGQSPIDFVISYRLEMSRRMLIDSDKSITDISLSCGFNHSSYFTKLFLRKYGCTPSEYRRTFPG